MEVWCGLLRFWELLAVSFPAWFDGGIVVCGNCLAVDDFCGLV